MNHAISSSHRHQFTTGQIARAGVIAAVAATVANVIVYLIAEALGAIPADLPSTAEMLGVPAVIVTCVLTIAVATLAFWVFNQFSENPVKNFVILSGIVFATSLTGPFSIEGASAGLITSLLAMHVVAAAIVVFVFTRLGSR